MLNFKWSRFKENFRGPGAIIFLLPGVLILTLYLLSGSENQYDQYFSFKSLNDTETVDGYLVWNSKCHMISKSPIDPSIAKFVKRVKYEACSKSPLLSLIKRDRNGSNILMLNNNEAKHYKNLVCCWAPIIRPTPGNPKSQKYFDSKIKIESCVNFNNSLILPREVELLHVSCKNKKKTSGKSKDKMTAVYDNIHSVYNTDKVSKRLNISEVGNSSSRQRKLSILLIGIDNVSRLNFKRSLLQTENYLREKGWLSMEGYDKMGENTFPNLMAILTGQTERDSYKTCKPTLPYYLDHCSIIWYNFRNAGYITAYAEDEAAISTFNYHKVGFVDPPTDYYLRPYTLACEKILKIRRKFGAKYCTGPEAANERIFDAAVDFAKVFLNQPYFGFFWMNSASHDDWNAISSTDSKILSKFEHMEREGVMNDSMIIFLSDHGMRLGEMRSTFTGWYEERLPFHYIWIPEWFREEYPETYQALIVNQNRLTSPFDVYETLRDILIRSGGEALPSSGCPTCTSLFKPVPKERGCEDAGIAPHWCVCTGFEKQDVSDKIIAEGAQKIVDHIEDIVKNYKSKKGERLCAKLKLKKIYAAQKVLNFGESSNSNTKYFIMFQTVPGNAKYEATIQYHGSGNYSVIDEELSTITSYAYDARCLDHGQKKLCYCLE